MIENCYFRNVRETAITAYAEPFWGILDGNGHKIIGLRIEATNETCLGLFSTLEGTVKNLTLENCEVSAAGMSEKIGILAGENKGTVENVVISGSVNAKYFSCVGGIVGTNQGVLQSSVNNGIVKASSNVGGIVYNNEKTVIGCTNNGTIECGSALYDGICQTNKGTVSNCVDNTK